MLTWALSSPNIGPESAQVVNPGQDSHGTTKKRHELPTDSQPYDHRTSTSDRVKKSGPHAETHPRPDSLFTSRRSPAPDTNPARIRAYHGAESGSSYAA